MRQAGGRGTLVKGAVAAVAVEGVDHSRAGTVQVAPVYSVNIQPAIAVVVPKGPPAAHGFWKEFLRAGAVLVDKVKAGLGSDIDKMHRRIGGGR